ncbi:MAG: hypothetical protein U0X39_01515 [Bacteroidales bacterium]
MKKKILFLLSVTILALFAGCSTLVRYRVLYGTSKNDNLVDVNVFRFRLSDNTSEKQSKTLWDLNAEAQAQLLKIYNSRYPGNKSFNEALERRYLESADNLPQNDFTKRDLRMVFSISKNRGEYRDTSGKTVRTTPADRIEYLKVSIKASDPLFRFTGWNFFTTEYATIDIANISSSRSFDLTGELSASKTVKDESGKNISLSPTVSSGMKVDQTLKYRYLKLNGQLNDSTISIEEEGTRENDLTGNIVADVSIEFNKFPVMLATVKGLRDSTGKPAKAENVEADFDYVLIPAVSSINDKIEAELSIDYVYRKVFGGKKSYPEWNDWVRYYTGHVSKKITILNAADFVPGFYGLGVNQGVDKYFLSASDSNLEGVPLFFRTYKEARDFLDWFRSSFAGDLKRKPLRVGNYDLIITGRDTTGVSRFWDNINILSVFW